MQLSQGEKLILLMLCEIQEHLKVKGDTDTELVKDAIISGNLWGLEWGLPGVFHGSETPDNIVSETVKILAMWQRLEQSFNGLSPQDKGWLASNSALGSDVRFHGFDGNDQTEVQYISAGRFLVERLKRFDEFKERDFNAHMPTLDAYRRMLAVFDPILHRVLNKDFSAAQIAKVLDAYKHPDA
ncbi:MAG TPA: YfbU family protein [Terriglobales bacterium]|nr:YfbU family protein [Terriglobales bacterium]